MPATAPCARVDSYPTPCLGRGRCAIDLGALASCRRKQVLHPDRLVEIGCNICGIERDVPDISAGKIKTSQLSVIEAFRGHCGRKHPLPDAAAHGLIGKWEPNQERDPAQERGIEIDAKIACEDCKAAIRLDALQQIADLNVCVAIMAVADFTASPEERVGFIEEENRAGIFRRVEDRTQILLGLTDVLTDHLTEIDAPKIETQIVCEDLRRKGLAGSTRPMEKGGNTEPS